MLKDIQNLMQPIKSARGLMNVQLNLTGQIKDVYNVVFNKNIFANGRLELKENIVKIDKIPSEIKNLTGFVNFENLNADFILSSGIGSSKLNLGGKFNDNILDVKVISDKFTLADGAKLALPEGQNFRFQKILQQSAQVL